MRGRYMNIEKKSRLLYVMKILCENSDEQHPLTIHEIIEQLSEYGIEAFRTTVVSDIAMLEEFGIDVICNRSVQNQYFIGQREFELPELKLLIDAVGASRFIPTGKSKELIEKLSGFASRHQAEVLKKHICVDNRVKQPDAKVYYTVDLLHSAIERKEEISFQYFDYAPDKKKIKKHNGYTYIFSPYQQKESDKQWRASAILCREQPSCHYRQGHMESCAGRNGTAVWKA